MGVTHRLSVGRSQQKFPERSLLRLIFGCACVKVVRLVITLNGGRSVLTFCCLFTHIHTHTHTHTHTPGVACV